MSSFTRLALATLALSATVGAAQAQGYYFSPALPIDEVAQAAGTVGYELMCALAQRVPVVVDGVA